jgi:ribosomal protein L40E
MTSHASPAKYGGVSGTLAFDRDTLTFTRMDGIFKKTMRVAVRIPLDAIVNVNMESNLFGRKKLVILTDGLKFPGIPRHEFEVPDPDQWVNVLQTRMNKITEEEMKEEVKIVKEREIVKIPCRYCGALNAITETVCSKCGAPVK